ncbi:MAG: FKBP-type peptidyl-prolyl cis-trans isomerase [Saprospiraceae bacterium]
MPPEEILTRPLPPNYEILFMMSIGDSVTVTQELKDLENLPEGFTTEDRIKYVVKLIDIIPKEELEQAKKKNKTTSNYPYEIFNKSGNITAQPGDRIRYREYRYINNVLEKETPMDQPLQASLPARDMIPNPPPGNYEALLLGGIGDSLHLDQLLVGVKNLPKNLKETDTINYRIQIVDVFTPGEFEIEKLLQNAKAQQLKKETIARKEEVEKTTLANIKKFKSGEIEDELIYTHSGLKYILHEKGKGKKTSPLQKVAVHYMGFLPDGKVFDTTFDDGKSFEFPLGAEKVIKGWDEGISKLTVGSKATFFVPYQLAYGRAGWYGKIPRRADLVFYIELLSSK